MCCYKLVTMKFKVFGFESIVDNFVAKVIFSLLFSFVFIVALFRVLIAFLSTVSAKHVQSLPSSVILSD